VLIHNDSGSEHEEWAAALNSTRYDPVKNPLRWSRGVACAALRSTLRERWGVVWRRHYIVHSGNLHEVRGYNRLVRMASSDVVALLQDDDIPPRGARSTNKVKVELAGLRN
jgi:hypothetical protein